MDNRDKIDQYDLVEIIHVPEDMSRSWILGILGLSLKNSMMKTSK